MTTRKKRPRGRPKSEVAKVVIHTRVTPDVVEKLKEYAVAEKRSFAGTIEYAINLFIKDI